MTDPMRRIPEDQGPPTIEELLDCQILIYLNEDGTSNVRVKAFVTTENVIEYLGHLLDHMRITLTAEQDGDHG